MDAVMEWIQQEGTGHWFFVAFPVCLLILFILMKGRRVRFLVPSLIISIVIVNPWFYKKWIELGLYAYWRVLWVIPVIPLIASVVPVITERIEKPYSKGLVAMGGAIAIILCGSFIYSTDRGQFVETANAEKVPKYVSEIADKLLELDEHPRVIAQDPIGVYLRQYTGRIDTLYGRDIDGYITFGKLSEDAKGIHEAMLTGDWNIVNQFMLDDGFDYLVASGDFSNSPLKLVNTAGDYGIYSASGHPAIVKERNELGQVVRLSNVDINGDLENRNGFATVEYEYDPDGNIKEEFRKNKNAKQINSAMANQYMASGVRAAYHNMRLIHEAYYDDEGNLETQPAGHVAIEQEWDAEGNLLSRTYLGPDGLPMNRIDGYAKVMWTHDENGTRLLQFYDSDGKAVEADGINILNGSGRASDEWSEWMIPEYDTMYSCFEIDNMILGEKTVGDNYTCQIEIEFKDVEKSEEKEFLFQAQGTVDGEWKVSNIWTPDTVKLTVSPDNGVYQYKFTKVLDDNMAEASDFQVGFRCDNWASGSFRIRNFKIEKGTSKSEWTPGL